MDAVIQNNTEGESQNTNFYDTKEVNIAPRLEVSQAVEEW